MKTQKIDLYNYFGIKRTSKEQGYLITYTHDVYDYCPHRIRPAILVVGGGGYRTISNREQEPVVLEYLSKGFNCYNLIYSTVSDGNIHYPSQLLEACMAMLYLRTNCKKMNIDKNHIACIGFSAGAHLSAMLGNMWNNKDMQSILKNNAETCRPNAILLCYPVITSGKKAHQGSFEILCGDNKQLKEYLSLEKAVTKNSSPAFIWTTMDDETVPSENSLLYATACKKHKVPFELHIFAHGKHGLSLCNKEVNSVSISASKWLPLSLTWLEEQGFVISVE